MYVHLCTTRLFFKILIKCSCLQSLPSFLHFRASEVKQKSVINEEESTEAKKRLLQKRKYITQTTGVRKSTSLEQLETRRNVRHYSDVSRSEHRKTIFIGNNTEDDDSSDEELNISDEEEDTTSDTIDARLNNNSFVKFAESVDLQDIISHFNQVKSELSLPETVSSFHEIFDSLFSDLSSQLPHRYTELLRHIHNKSLSKEYKNNLVASGKQILIIGTIIL